MAKPADLGDEVVTALDNVPEGELGPTGGRAGADYHAARRIKALQLKLAGFSIQQIAENLKISDAGVRDLLKRTLTRAEKRDVDEMRDIENARLDRLQAAIWSKALEGNMTAINGVLAISRQRVQLNGLNAPTRIEVSSGIRDEMQKSLGELEALVDQAGKQRYDDDIQDAIVVQEQREITTTESDPDE